MLGTKAASERLLLVGRGSPISQDHLPDKSTLQGCMFYFLFISPLRCRLVPLIFATFVTKVYPTKDLNIQKYVCFFAYNGLYPYIFNRIGMFSSNEIKVH